MDKIFMVGVAVLTLAILYLFQRVNFLDLFITAFGWEVSLHSHLYFIFNKTFRMIGNDLACIILIFVFFRERKYLVGAWYVFLIELLVILPVYFVFKLTLEGDSEISSPLLSQFHRLIVNPILMILLMAGFVYQKTVKK